MSINEGFPKGHIDHIDMIGKHRQEASGIEDIIQENASWVCQMQIQAVKFGWLVCPLAILLIPPGHDGHDDQIIGRSLWENCGWLLGILGWGLFKCSTIQQFNPSMSNGFASPKQRSKIWWRHRLQEQSWSNLCQRSPEVSGGNLSCR